MCRRINEIVRHSEVSEKAIERYLVAEVEKRGGLCLKYSNPFSVGYPDRIVLLPEGNLLWVELKSKGKKPRRIQEVAHKRLMALGQKVFVADSKEKIDELLKTAI